MLSPLLDAAHWLHALYDHRRTLRMSRAELEAMQLVKFRRLVKHAQAHSPYWQRVIAEHRINPESCVPTDFPVLTKKQITDHFDEMVTDRRITRADLVRHAADPKHAHELYLGEYRVVHTSGTSGMSLYQLFSLRAWRRGASLITRVTPPFRFRMRVAYVASTMAFTGGSSLMNAGNQGLNRLLFNVRMYDACTPMPETVQALNEFQPQTLGGYSMIIQMLAEEQLRGALNIRPLHVGVGGEALTTTGRAMIEKAFGVPVHVTYASTEHLYMGLSLPPDLSMHLMEDDLMFELHEDHTCITNLFGDTLPLIRHRMDDILHEETDLPPTHLPFRRVTVSGRMENALFYDNDEGVRDFVHPLMLTDFIAPSLIGWQAVVTGPTGLTLRLLFEESASAETRASSGAHVLAQMNRIFKTKRMTRVQVTLEVVESLPVDPKTGKYRLVVNESAAA